MGEIGGEIDRGLRGGGQENECDEEKEDEEREDEWIFALLDEVLD